MTDEAGTDEVRADEADGTSGDVDERTIGDLVVRIDRRLCVGFADCVDEAPDAFVLDDEGIAIFVEGAEGTDRERVIAACVACPVDALTALDADGEVVAP